MPPMTDEEAAHNESRNRQQRESPSRRTWIEIAMLLILLIGGFISYRIIGVIDGLVSQYHFMNLLRLFR